MSIFSRKAYKGAMRDHRARRYEAAVMRQDELVLAARPVEKWAADGMPVLMPPAPVEEFLRPGDVVRVSGTLRWVGRAS